MRLSAPGRRQFRRWRDRGERYSLPLGSTTGSRSARLEPPQPPSARAEAAAEQQQAAAAAVDEFANQILLRGSEVAGFHRADDESLIARKDPRRWWETVGQFLGIVDALAINFIFGGAQHGGDLHDAVVVLGAADELVFPARLAFHVKDAALVATRR